MRKIILVVSIFCAASFCIYNAKNEQAPMKTTELVDLEKDDKYNERDEEEERKSDHPSEFALFNQAIRTKDGEDEPGYLPGYRMQELAKAQEARKYNQSSNARTEATNGVIEWKERGPANVPGRTLAILDLPSDANHLTWLAGAATGGVWKTTNGGTSWTEKSKNFSILPISSLAMSQEVGTKIIYAGTGEFVSTSSSAVGDGIFKSTDLGETWTQLSATKGNKDFLVVTRIIVDPINANLLLASCVSSPYTIDRKSTIQRSTDGGATWASMYSSSIAIEQLVSTPGNFSVLYATQRATGVVKSIDGGLTWAASSNGLTASGRIEIAISPANPSRLFASTEGGVTGTGSDLYFSNDDGATWAVVDVSLSNAAVDFLGGQGYYDNTIACDPFNQDIVYFGGVNYFRLTLGTTSSNITNYTLDESKISPFINLVSASGVTYAGGKLSVSNSPNFSVELRFGPGKKQKAHRFLVPTGSSSGVPDANYTYQDYVDVDFEAWDITNNKQLMVSFRDQGRDGKFNLIPVNTDNTDVTLQSREYLFVHNLDYNAALPDATVAVNGGHKIKTVYNIWPSLAANATWPTSQNANLAINATAVVKQAATTITVADAYSKWDGKNKVNQTDLTAGVHPDHHTTTIIPVDKVAKTFKFLIGNDGGVFASNTSTTPGIANGDFKFAGYGYNTGQFYSADKKPNVDQYIGGLQDNGTRFSPQGETAGIATNYSYALGGDGFETLWHSLDGNKLLASTYYNGISKSIDGGATWTAATTGITNANNSANFPFFTKLSNSKKFPDRVFTIGGAGVFVSNDFGSNWTPTSITSNLSGTSFYADVEVSQSNANIVWAGSGMSSTRNLFVSTDGGKSFTKTINYTGATLGGLTRLASHPTQDSTAFALFSFANSPKILRTKDLGKTWQDISGFGSGTSSNNGFPNVGVFCLYVRPDNTNIIWAGTEVGIVESLDGGVSWNILTDFPHVNVWDMKGQDDQVVIATHGRGIWTAKINSPQLISNPPTIAASGTSPQGKFLVKINFPVSYDSVQLKINATFVGTIKNPTANSSSVVPIIGVPPGSASCQLIAFTKGAPVSSPISTHTMLSLKALQSQYYNLFMDASDITSFNSSGKTTGYIIKTLSGTNTSLQSNHDYDVNVDLSAVVLQPITVSSANPNLFYKDVALVVADGDYVTVEATKDGLTWTPLIGNYNSSANTTWASAVTSGVSGTNEMQVSHTLSLTPTFAVGDVLLFRFRLSSNTAGTGWGWSIDDLYIQQTPTGLEDAPAASNLVGLTIYPNPTKSISKVSFHLNEESPVTLSITNLSGKAVQSTYLGVKPKGDYEETLPADLSSGIYFIRIKTNQGVSVGKLLVTE